MKPHSVAAIAAIVASVSLSGLTPVMAQDVKAARSDRMLEFRAGADGRFEFTRFTCSTRAADRMERRFDALAERLKLTDEQKKLYDTFMTSALTAQTNFADACAGLRPERPARAERAERQERPDLLARMEMRLKLDEARLAAMNAVFPDFKAFYGSLTEEQQAELFPGQDRAHRHFGKRHFGLNG